MKKQGTEFLNYQVKMVFFDALSDKYNSENADLSRSDQAIDIARGETPFMKEVLRSFAYRDSGLIHNIPKIEWKISVKAATPEGSELRDSSRLNLMQRNREEVFYSTDMMYHLEMMDYSSSSSK